MALPTLISAWKFQVNQSIAGGATSGVSAQNLLWAIKESIKGNGSWTDGENVSTSAPTDWTVVGSSNSSTSNMSGTDTWTTAANVVWAIAGSPHSWIVLRHATLGDILLDVSNNQTTSMTVAWSKAGFGAATGGTNGSTSAAPTATDTVTLINNTTWGGPVSTASGRLHVMHTTAGLHLVACRTGWPIILFDLAQVVDSPVSVGLWATQVVSRWSGTGTAAPAAAPSISADVKTTAFLGRNSVGLTFSPMTWGRAAGDTVLFSDAAHGLNGEVPLLPIAVYCTTGSNEGLYGFVPDMWLTLDAARHFGFPDDTPAEWQAFSNTVLPWNKTTALLS